jgi:hypothetical protein
MYGVLEKSYEALLKDAFAVKAGDIVADGRTPFQCQARNFSGSTMEQQTIESQLLEVSLGP